MQKLKPKNTEGLDWLHCEKFKSSDWFKPTKIKVNTAQDRKKYYCNYVPLYTHIEIRKFCKTHILNESVTTKIADDLNYLFMNRLVGLYRLYYENGIHYRISTIKEEKERNEKSLLIDSSKLSFIKNILEIVFRNKMQYESSKIEEIDKHLNKHIFDEINFFARKEFSLFLTGEITKLSAKKRKKRKKIFRLILSEMFLKLSHLDRIDKELIRMEYVIYDDKRNLVWQGDIRYPREKSYRLVALSTVINESELLKKKYSCRALYWAFNTYYHAKISSPNNFKTSLLHKSDEFKSEFSFIDSLTK